MEWVAGFSGIRNRDLRALLAYLKGKAFSAAPVMLPEGRAPLQARLFDWHS